MRSSLGRHRRVVAVQRAARRGEDDGGADASGRLDDVERAHHVDFAVAPGVLDRGDHARLRGEVEDRVGLDLLDERQQPVEFDDVQLAQLGVCGDAARIAGGQVVDDRHLVALAEQRVDDV